MAITCSPYLNFDGNTRDAMEFYHDVFGGELIILTFADIGVPDMPADAIMHAALKTDRFMIMASEAQPGAAQTWQGTRNYISLMGDAGDLPQLTGWFARLSEGGHVGTPLQRMPWGDHWGQCTDRFGIEWMVDAPAEPVANA